jgi:hypothetical protein
MTMTARSLTTLQLWVLGLILGGLHARALCQPTIISQTAATDETGAAPQAPAVVEASREPAPLETAAIQPAASAPATTDQSPSSANAPEPPAQPRAMSAQLAVGAGFGSRAITIPSRRSDRRLSTGNFPSLQVSLRGELLLRRRWLLGAAANYQTAVGLQAASIAPNAGNSVDGAELRSNSLTFGLMPGYRFGRAPDSVALRIFFGWGIRALHTVVDLETPSYSLQAITLRPELTLPLAGNRVVLRIAPELALIVWASQRLVELANAATPGVALGGEAALDVQVYAGLHAALAYRESHGMLSTEWGSYLRDSERFVALQLALHR